MPFFLQCQSCFFAILTTVNDVKSVYSLSAVIRTDRVVLVRAVF